MYSLKAKAQKANTTLIQAENMDDVTFENNLSKQQQYKTELLDQIAQDRMRKDHEKKVAEAREREEEEKLQRYQQMMEQRRVDE